MTENLQTVGFSKKVLATVLTVAGAQLVALIVNVIESGEFDRTEFAQLIAIALTAVLGPIVGYLAPANPVTTPTPVHPSTPRHTPGE